MRGHIFQGFFGLVHEPVKPSKIEDHSVETTSTGVALCSNFCLLRKACEHNEGSSPGIVSSTTWCSIGQRRADGRVQHEREHCRMSVKIRRLPRKITQTDMGTEFGCEVCILCADSLHPRKTRFPSFHIACRCVFASFDSSVFWLFLSLSTLFAELWFCPLCSTKGYCIRCKNQVLFLAHLRKTE